MPTDKDIFFSILSREIDNLTCLHPALSMFNGVIKNKIFNFINPYLDFFIEEGQLQVDMATSFLNREISSKLNCFKQEFLAETQNNKRD